jgi:hypothetical protein
MVARGQTKRERSEGDEPFCGSDSADYDSGEGWANAQSSAMIRGMGRGQVNGGRGRHSGNAMRSSWLLPGIGEHAPLKNGIVQIREITQCVMPAKSGRWRRVCFFACGGRR